MNITTKDIYNTSNQDSLLKSLGPYRLHTTSPFVDDYFIVIEWGESVPDVVIGELVWDNEEMFDKNQPHPALDHKEQSSNKE